MSNQLLAVLGLFEGPAPTRNVWFDGVVFGLVIGLLAMGVILIYRSTKVINFAVGNMGLPGASLFALLVINWGWPFWPALIASLLVGALIGAQHDMGRFELGLVIVKTADLEPPRRHEAMPFGRV